MGKRRNFGFSLRPRTQKPFKEMVGGQKREMKKEIVKLLDHVGFEDYCLEKKKEKIKYVFCKNSSY